MKLESIIHDVCCDDRIKDGTLRLENPEHVFVLQEYLEKAGYNINEIVAKTAKLFIEGRFPDRQAYNKDGILVTFPSKEYRTRAVDKGTHFAENPKKNVGTLYSPTDTGNLSTSDVSTDPTNTDATPKKKSDTVSLDQELNKKVAGDIDVDNRSTKDKVQDAEAVQSILTNTTPLLNYSVDEAKNFGFYNKGFNWYDCDGNLIGEQVYDDSMSKSIIQMEKKEPVVKCDAKKLEYNLASELNNKRTNDVAAKKIADSLKKNDGVKSCEALGNLGCPIVDPLFSQLNQTSKTDLLFIGKKRMRASLKAEVSQVCSAQNAEVNAVVSSVLKHTGESANVMEGVSSFIMDGLEKSFYVALQDEVKEKLNKAMTAVIRGESIKTISASVADVEKIIKTNKDYVVAGKVPVDMTKTLTALNTVFMEPKRRYMLIEELATGKRRFADGEGNFKADCIADHMMTWNCAGQYHLYTVEKFLQDNDKNISFRFSNRGGVRGIAIRGDIKLAEIALDEAINDTLKNMGRSLTNFFGDFTDKIKLLVGEAKVYFTKVWETTKAGLQSIYESILKFGRFLKALIQQGWEFFANVIGLEGQADGGWQWETPGTSATEVKPEEPINV
jgi:hypothetical protein